MSHRPVPRILTRNIASFLALALGSVPVAAATWTGTNDNSMATGANWGGTAPLSGDSFIFTSATGAGGLLLNNNLTSGAFSVSGITFNAGSGAYVLGDGTTSANVGNSFVLAGNITNSSTSLQAINNPFSMTAARTVTLTSGGGNVALGGNLSGTGGGLTLAGAGTLTLSGNNSFTGGLSFGTTPTSRILQLQANSNNTTAGVSSVMPTQNMTLAQFSSGATLQLRADSAIASGGIVAFDSAATTFGVNSLGNRLNGTYNFDVNQLTPSGGSNLTLQFGATNAIWNVGTANSTFNVTGGNGYTLQLGTFNMGNNISLVFNDTANLVVGALTNASTGGVTKSGTGTLTITGVSNYTGNTSIQDGKLSVGQIGSSAATGNLGAGTAINFGSGATTGTLLYTGTGETTSKTITLSTSGAGGGVIDQSGTGLLKFSSFAATGANSHALTLQGSTAGTGEISAAIVDNSVINKTSVIKSGSGTWTLSGASSYTGTTTVNAGTLITTPAQTGATTVNVADGATFGVKLSTVGTTFSAATLNTGTSTGSALLLDTGALGNPTAPIINVTTFTPSAPTQLKVSGSALTLGNNIPLLDYTGSIGGLGFAGLSVALPARTVGNLVDNSIDTRIDLNITQFEQIKWKGNTNGTWDADTDGTGSNGTQNWVTTVNLTPTKYLQGTGGTDTVNFDDSASGNTAINLAIAVNPLGTAFNNTALNYTISSTGGFGIGGSGTLTKSGNGSLTLNTANSYSGGTTLGGGTLNIGNASALGSGPMTISGGVLDNTSGGALSLSTGNTQNWNGDFIFTGSNNLDVGSGAVAAGGTGDRSVTITAGMLSVGELKTASGQGFAKLGAGTLALSSVGAGTAGSVINGILNVANGTLQINRTGASSGASGDLVASGLTGNGSITNGASVARWLILNNTDTSTFNGTLADGGSAGLGLDKQGAGTLILAGNNTYSDTTTVEGGILAVTGTLGNTTVNITGGTLSLQNSGAYSPNLAKVVTVGAAGTLDETADNAIGGQASLVLQRSLALGRPNTYTGDTTINAGTGTTVTITDPAGAGTGRLNAASGATAPVFALHINGGGTIPMANSFGGNSGITATINVDNNGSGSNGLIQLNGTGLWGNSSLNITGSNGYNLAIAGLINNTGAGSGNSILNPTTANLSLGTFTSATAGTKTLVLDGTSTANFVTNAISDGSAGTVALTKSNSSTWTLSGTSTYSGPTAVTGGALIVNGNLLGSSAVNLNSGLLGGSGTISNLLTLGDGIGIRDATLSPGVGIGIFHAMGGAAFQTDAVFSLEINSSALTTDLLTSSGAVSLGLDVATLDVTDLGNSVVNTPESFTFIDAAGGVSGEFAGLPEGTTLTAGSNTYQIHYTPTTVEVDVIPEPASATLLLTAGVFLGLRPRKKTPIGPLRARPLRS